MTTSFFQWTKHTYWRLCVCLWAHIIISNPLHSSIHNGCSFLSSSIYLLIIMRSHSCFNFFLFFFSLSIKAFFSSHSIRDDSTRLLRQGIIEVTCPRRTDWGSLYYFFFSSTFMYIHCDILHGVIFSWNRDFFFLYIGLCVDFVFFSIYPRHSHRFDELHITNEEKNSTWMYNLAVCFFSLVAVWFSAINFIFILLSMSRKQFLTLLVNS